MGKSRRRFIVFAFLLCGPALYLALEYQNTAARRDGDSTNTTDVRIPAHRTIQNAKNHGPEWPLSTSSGITADPSLKLPDTPRPNSFLEMAGSVGPWKHVPEDRRWTLKGLACSADVILVGRVSSDSARNASEKPQPFIYTNYELQVETVIKGKPSAKAGVEIMGGRLGNKQARASHMPVLLRGPRYLLFLKADDGLMCPIIGNEQGVFQVIRAEGDGMDYLRDCAGRPVARWHMNEPPTVLRTNVELPALRLAELEDSVASVINK